MAGYRKKTKAKAKAEGESAAKTDGKTEEKKKTPEEQYAEDRKDYRASTPRHTLKLEVSMDEDTKRKVFAEANLLRMAGNRLTGILEPRVNALLGQQAYKDLQKQYGKLKNKADKLKAELAVPDIADDAKTSKTEMLKQVAEELECVKQEMRKMQAKCGLTWTFARKEMEKIAAEMGLHSVYRLTRSEDIWQGVEDILYRDGEKLSYKRKGDLPVIKAKQINRGIPIHVVDGKLQMSVSLHASRKKIHQKYAEKLNKMDAERGPDRPLTQHEKEAVKAELKRTEREDYPFTLIVKKDDLFAEEELANVIRFLKNPEVEKQYVEMWKNGQIPPDSFRPCYASLVCDTIRGKLRVYCCISIEGKACPKRNRDGSFRHTWGHGVMGVDLGPQSVETATENDVSADNLAERNGHSTFETEAKEKELLRAMERSRRATNPEYYNPNGTIRKGKKKWKYSKHYKKLKKKYHELCRKNALNRKYAINEMVNDLRTRADTIHIEPSNVKAMQVKAKKKEDPSSSQKKPDGASGTKSAPSTSEAVAVQKPDASAQQEESSQKKRKKRQKNRKKNGKMRYRGQGRRKRFGRSILHRNPGYFFEQLRRVFEATGGKFLIVDFLYRASQYDHCANTYRKKKLSERWHRLPDGTLVQRDLYSAFLLMCAKEDLSSPDQQLCFKYFDQFLKNHDACLARIDADKRRICNIKKRPA